MLVNNGWGNLLGADGSDCVVRDSGLYASAYFDFSGYCDIASGCARLLGLRLPMNFDSPYGSLSVTEFWKRWHMTLTSFLRENVYFPAGRHPKGPGPYISEHFGGVPRQRHLARRGVDLHPMGPASRAGAGSGTPVGKRRDALPRWVRWAMTFLFINLAWVFFRAPDVSSALLLLKTAVTGGMGGIRLWLVNGLFRREISALELLLPVIEPYTAYLRVALIWGSGCWRLCGPGTSSVRWIRSVPTGAAACMCWRGRYGPFCPSPAW